MRGRRRGARRGGGGRFRSCAAALCVSRSSFSCCSCWRFLGSRSPSLELFCVLCTLARRRFFSKRSVVFSRVLFPQVLIHDAFKTGYDRKKLLFPGGASSCVKIDEQEVVRPRRPRVRVESKNFKRPRSYGRFEQVQKFPPSAQTALVGVFVCSFCFQKMRKIPKRRKR